jgi:CDP-diacylglycerol--serine O-phosphatidyltransferase
VGFLSVLMVSTIRFSSFKEIGTRSRSMRTVILVVGFFMLLVLYSRHVLLGLATGYILYGLLSRAVGMFRRRPDLSKSKIQAKEI